MLGLGNSISASQYPGGEWLPSDEGSLEAWYRFGEGVTLNGSDVSSWADSSSNSFDMVNNTATEQPAYSAGVLTFAPADSNNLRLASGHIVLDGAFVIGFRIYPVSHNTTVVASQALSNELFKLIDADTIRVRNDGSINVNYDLDSGDTKDDAYWVLSRDGSDNLSLYKDGVLQGSAQSCPGTFDIDSIGARKTTPNYFDGIIKEIVFFKGTTSAALIANIHDRLSGL